MNAYRSSWKKIGLTLVFFLSAFSTMLIFMKKETHISNHQDTEDQRSESSKVAKSIMNEIEKPVSAEEIKIMEQLDQPKAGVLSECSDTESINALTRNNLSDVINNFEHASPSAKNCLAALGVTNTCLTESTRKECRFQIMKSRATLIDQITANIDTGNLSQSVLVNKLVSNIFSEDSAQNADKIFSLSDKLLSDYSDNENLHNVRGLFGVLTLANNENAEILEKGTYSADRLLESSSTDKIKKGLMIKYSYKLVAFYRNKTATVLNDAEEIAKSYLKNFPDDPTGCYMLMQLNGYRGNKSKAIEWLDRGLAFGTSQPHYMDYREVRRLLETGPLDPDYLGIRLDYREQFNPESLVEEGE